MLDRLFGGENYLIATRALDTAALRHAVSAHNLANVDTPGYKRQEVLFEDALRQARGRSSDPCGAASCPPVAGVRPRVVTVRDTSERQDGNNVNMEIEGVNMAINALRFDLLASQVGSYLSGLKAVIAGR